MDSIRAKMCYFQIAKRDAVSEYGQYLKILSFESNEYILSGFMEYFVNNYERKYLSKVADGI